ncbi:hypothetical protein SAMN02910357_00805 [Succinivibrio dextrinosolvens]|jgi:hypothetical protein|uniref:Uncharacterized protein n=1 Tax=Succinivibrio dextrinosolvens TaxID=83771 RepID=A0A662ZMS0_9GAMM|nr:hypothetical protein [Succinivibrio dextrinosolvens]MDY6420357.1 hypothetical protein [Succinivibrio dextrinosolvens]SFK17586.1 hypothetical protein SAMN04487865_10339 [Succinivibrio dextrinosolvens]SFS44925.1 hypothetical protein SAMN02910357_00805 [Succinivibrio dextrinosolvens]
MLSNKTDFFIGLAAGVVAGAVGYKLFQDHKEQILGSFDSLTSKFSKTEETALSEEELQAQKEHLEDLIAEQKAAKKSK